jgi:hypothetical protein
MSAAPLPEDSAAQAELAAKLASLKLDPPQGATTSRLIQTVSGLAYKVNPNPINIEAVTLTFGDAAGVLSVKTAMGIDTISFGYGAWHAGSTPLFFGHETPIVASGVWSTENTLVLTVRFAEKPFMLTLEFWFGASWLKIHTEMNYSFQEREHLLTAAPVPEEA